MAAHNRLLTEPMGRVEVRAGRLFIQVEAAADWTLGPCVRFVRICREDDGTERTDAAEGICLKEEEWEQVFPMVIAARHRAKVLFAELEVEWNRLKAEFEARRAKK